MPGPGSSPRRGEDFPAVHLERLRDLGIDTGGVRPTAGPTVRNWVVYEEDGRRSWVYRTPPGRPLEVAVQPDHLPDAWLAATPAPVVHVAAMPLAAAEAIVARVRERASRAVITLDTHEDWVGRLRAAAANHDQPGADGYPSRLASLLACQALIALPGGVGTLSELAVAWAARQTEPGQCPLVLVGEGWRVLLDAFSRHLVVDARDLSLVRVVSSPAQAVEAVLWALAENGAAPDPRG